MVDQEEVPGYHASGRNASLLLSSVGNREVRKIVARSRAAFLERREEVGYRPVGSLLLGTSDQLEAVRDPELSESRLLSSEEAREMVPILEGHDFPLALLTPSDGVMDISRLLQFYLSEARKNGPEILLNEKVNAIEKIGQTYRVTTSSKSIETTTLVNAAGAWAPHIAELAGVAPLPMDSFKRHLFILEGINDLSVEWPFVWSLDKEFYFRPESGGLLFSVCDEELHGDGFVQTVNPAISEELASLASKELPCLENALERRVWSCFRTKTPHGGFHLKWVEGESFFWVAGLGGHGMGASWELGRLAALQLNSGSSGRK